MPGTVRNYRVRSQTYSGGQSVGVRVVGMPELFAQCEGIVPGSREFHVRSFDNAEHDTYVTAETWQEAIATARRWYAAPASERFGVSRYSTARACPNRYCAGHQENAGNPSAEHHRVLTAEGRRVLGVLERLHEAYNHDGSDVMTDYFDRLYFGTVEVYEHDNRDDQAAA
jgi:hypothetical protein